jgi:hypothetical protein
MIHNVVKASFGYPRMGVFAGRTIFRKTRAEDRFSLENAGRFIRPGVADNKGGDIQ